MENYKRALLYVNGVEIPGFFVRGNQSDFLVAVDGGLHHLVIRKRLPDLLIGDLDSVDPREYAACEAANVEIIKYPPAKDKSDLELALDLVIERGFKDIVIVYPFGSRMDYSVANITQLYRPDLADIKITLDDGKTEMHLLRDSDSLSLETGPNSLISLIAIGDAAKGISTRNVLYPLKKEPLYPWQTRGVSNVPTKKKITVYLTEGRLLVVHTRPYSNTKG